MGFWVGMAGVVRVAAEWPIHSDRPLRTLSLMRNSGGIAPVSCQSAETFAKWQIF